MDELGLVDRKESHGLGFGDTAEQITERHEQRPLGGFIDEDLIDLTTEPHARFDGEQNQIGIEHRQKPRMRWMGGGPALPPH